MLLELSAICVLLLVSGESSSQSPSSVPARELIASSKPAASTQPSAGLEFRILPIAKSACPAWTTQPEALPDESVDRAKAALDKSGPPAIHEGRGWYATDLKPEQVRNYVTHEHKGRTFVLAYTTPPDTMLRGDWSVVSAKEGLDQMGRPSIYFELDVRGAAKFADFTRSHLQRPLGMFVDDWLVQAAVIQSEIRGRGEIVGSFTPAQIEEALIRIHGAAPTTQPQ